jgi:hypothetical protein
MSSIQNALIVGLGILVSIILFTHGEKYNLENTDYGELVQECQELRFDYGSCVERRSAEIRKEYGASYRELESRKERQMTFLIIPCVVLITSLFVGFAVRRNEKYLAMLALTPLFLSFLRYYPYAPEKWMVPLYLFFAATIAFLISRIKRFLFFA